MSDKNNRMDFQVVAKCVIKEDTGLVVEEGGNKLQAGVVIMCKMTPFVITEDGDSDYLASRKKENVYQEDNQYFEFFKGKVKEL